MVMPIAAYSRIPAYDGMKSAGVMSVCPVIKEANVAATVTTNILMDVDSTGEKSPCKRIRREKII